MSATTRIHPDKVSAYLATNYRLGHTDQDIVLTIGKHSERLASLFTQRGCNCGAFITAYNPRGTQQSDEANDQAHANLASALVKLGITFMEGWQPVAVALGSALCEKGENRTEWRGN
jgi:Protein of unknown function (DUF3293)